MNIGLIIVLVVVVLLVLYFISCYNRFVRLRNLVKEAFSTMDVYLKKRWDLIPNIVSTVKGYAKHESETLEKVIAARSGATNYDSLSDEEKLEANKELSGAISKLLAVAESYPDLKANTNFLDLQDQLKLIEDDIANSRKYYNGCVLKYNNAIMMFPANIVASLFKFTAQKMYEVDDVSERQNVKVEF